MPLTLEIWSRGCRRRQLEKQVEELLQLDTSPHPLSTNTCHRSRMVLGVAPVLPTTPLLPRAMVPQPHLEQGAQDPREVGCENRVCENRSSGAFFPTAASR